MFEKSCPPTHSPAEHIAAHRSKINSSPPVNTALVKGSFYGQLASPRAEISCTAPGCIHLRVGIALYSTVWRLEGFTSSHQQCVFFSSTPEQKSLLYCILQRVYLGSRCQATSRQGLFARSLMGSQVAGFLENSSSWGFE